MATIFFEMASISSSRKAAGAFGSCFRDGGVGGVRMRDGFAMCTEVFRGLGRVFRGVGRVFRVLGVLGALRVGVCTMCDTVPLETFLAA